MRDSVILNDTHLNEASSFRPEHKIQMRRETRPAPTPQAAIPVDPDEIHGNDLQTKRYVKRGSVLDLVPLQVPAGDLWE